MGQFLEQIAFHRMPLRVALAKKILREMRWIPYPKRLEYDAIERPNYGFCIYNAAVLAVALGYPKISIIEFGVYGFIAYSSMLMLIISTIHEVPSQKSHSIVRAIYLIPGIICAMILASSGINIIAADITTINTILAVNTTEVFIENVTSSSVIELQNPIWVPFHFMLSAVMAIYVINQILILFIKI